ncbi:MAG: DUF2076 domain-containing protein [Telmatospirillum sp.]|nr:DUF2076 domain-containing protein [Telmatospirillum sp.]
MTPDEKKMIGELFERIAKNQEPAAQKDREAEAFIRDAVARDAGAAYTLTQMALVQEHALKLADERIRELEGKLGPAANAPAAPAKASFLDGLLPNSPWARKSSVPAMGAGTGAGGQPMVRPGMFGQNAGAQAAAPQGGSFLRSAFATAAGVAGGLMLFEAVRGLMASEPGGAFQQSAQAASPAAETPAPAEMAQHDMAQAPEPAYEDPGYHDVASNDAGYDDGGSFGGGDDFA